ncbi:hypothetical protein [Kineobactrum salinum]|uniref:Uncharacterized protein n=1 Tax=Kineobactrum salinum TaxID=2708301 RepID=A0A6C0U7Z6_9GAMM|nr:hypothetical protein [Kineobactrum salinum]QIB67137.1 hypothetical protein G3T16_18765 [Kineobactrum salinum]
MKYYFRYNKSDNPSRFIQGKVYVFNDNPNTRGIKTVDEQGQSYTRGWKDSPRWTQVKGPEASDDRYFKRTRVSNASAREFTVSKIYKLPGGEQCLIGTTGLKSTPDGSWSPGENPWEEVTKAEWDAQEADGGDRYFKRIGNSEVYALVHGSIYRVLKGATTFRDAVGNKVAPLAPRNAKYWEEVTKAEWGKQEEEGRDRYFKRLKENSIRDFVAGKIYKMPKGQTLIKDTQGRGSNPEGDCDLWQEMTPAEWNHQENGITQCPKSIWGATFYTTDPEHQARSRMWRSLSSGRRAGKTAMATYALNRIPSIPSITRDEVIHALTTKEAPMTTTVTIEQVTLVNGQRATDLSPETLIRYIEAQKEAIDKLKDVGITSTYILAQQQRHRDNMDALVKILDTHEKAPATGANDGLVPNDTTPNRAL